MIWSCCLSCSSSWRRASASCATAGLATSPRPRTRHTITNTRMATLPVHERGLAFVTRAGSRRRSVRENGEGVGRGGARGSNDAAADIGESADEDHGHGVGSRRQRRHGRHRRERRRRSRHREPDERTLLVVEARTGRDREPRARCPPRGWPGAAPKRLPTCRAWRRRAGIVLQSACRCWRTLIIARTAGRGRRGAPRAR